MLRKRTIVHLTSEVAPFYKRGGLGDVAGSLPRYLAGRYHNYVVSFHFEGKMTGLEKACRDSFNLAIHGIEYQIHYYSLRRDGVSYYFIDLDDQNVFSDSEAGVGPSGKGKRETAYREALPVNTYFYFAKAALHLLMRQNIYPDALLLHDWHVCGVFAYSRMLNQLLSKRSGSSLLLIHNYEFQGEILSDSLPFLDAECREAVCDQLQHYKTASLLGLAIDRADFVGTVSKTYAEELLSQRAPHAGLKRLLKLSSGVLDFPNGVDYQFWSPQTSPHLPVKYQAGNVATEKSRYRSALLSALGFSTDHRPLALFMARLTPQKGIHLLMDYGKSPEQAIAQFERLLQTGIRLVVHGTPEGGKTGRIHQYLSLAQERFPKAFFYDSDYSDEKAHQYLAGADMLLSPSFFEPCGLTQLYALAFGTVPIVNPVGGLKDTINCFRQNPPISTGFHLHEFSQAGLRKALSEALQLFHQQPEAWQELIRRGMQQDFSWDAMIRRYEYFFDHEIALYRLRRPARHYVKEPVAGRSQV